MSVRAIGEGVVKGSTTVDPDTGDIRVVYHYCVLGNDDDHQGLRYCGEIEPVFSFSATTAQIENAIAAAIQQDVLTRFGVSMQSNEVKLL